MVSCTLPEILPLVSVGEKIWFDDGKIGGIVKKVEPHALRIEITEAKSNGDRLGADKGINLPDTSIDLPAITSKDLEDLKFIVRHADLVGMSFVRHERDIVQLQSRLRDLDGDHLGILLKIETRQGFERLPNLMLAAMRQQPVGIMIAQEIWRWSVAMNGWRKFRKKFYGSARRRICPSYGPHRSSSLSQKKVMRLARKSLTRRWENVPSV